MANNNNQPTNHRNLYAFLMVSQFFVNKKTESCLTSKMCVLVLSRERAHQNPVVGNPCVLL